MAVALKDLDHGRRPPSLRVVPVPPAAPTPPAVYWARRAVVLLAVCAVVLLTVLAVRGVTARVEDPVARTNLVVVVEPGQTLWDIAATYAPDDRDLVAWTAEIADFNDIDAQSLAAGTPLVIPLETAVVTATDGESGG
ncbi:MAG TPA: LysM peptidoglycan-binding domain-containing protein [Euzebyales bacterium]|nr:LysM peptidoglycan-binding domain-containing protein [Euzebyales bacterium]